jgi:hypothetical protein
MPQGVKEIKYSVTLCKREGDGLPVMTPYKIGRKVYEKIVALIVKTQGKK